MSDENPEPEVDTLDIISDDTDEVIPDSEAPSKLAEEAEDEKDEIKLAGEDEEELEKLEKEEKEEEIVTPDKRREILKKYPTLFKEFPYLQKAYYREQQYTEILPTIEDAKEAVAKAEALNGFEQQLLAGDTSDVLTRIKNYDPEAFNKITDNYLPTLMKVDQGAYYHVIGNVLKQTIITMMNDGKAKNNDITIEAARILNQFVFGTEDFIPPNRLSKPETPQDQQLQNERMGFIRERFDTAVSDLSSKVGNVLRSTIDQHIDPRDSMTDYVKRNASREAYENLESLIDQDKAFRGQLDKLWEKAFEARFSRQSLDTIRSAYLSKAKTLLPRVIQKTRNEALKGTGHRVRSVTSESPTSSSKNRGTTPPSSSGKKSEIPKGMSTKEWLMQD